MANNVQVSEGLRDGLLGTSGLNTVFNSGVLEIRDGTQPANANTAPTGTVLAEINPLPADAFANPSGGAIAKLGTWEDTSANSTGTATWFRLKATGDLGTTNSTDERIDGTVGTSGSDLNLDSVSITAGQTVTIDTFTITLPAS